MQMEIFYGKLQIQSLSLEVELHTISHSEQNQGPILT